MSLRKWPLLVAALALTGLVAAGVGTAKNGGQTLDINAYIHKPLNCTKNTTTAQMLAYKVPKAKKNYDITLMEVSLAAYYYQGIAYGAEKAAKEAGVTLHITAGKGYTTPTLQLQQAENVLQRNTQAIVLAPVDIQGSVPVVQAAKKKNVPVINISTEVVDPYVYTVMQDDYLMGKAGADEIAKLLPKGGEGIIMGGPANATWSRKRAAGFEDQVKAKYPNLKVVDAPTSLVDPAEGLKKFQNAVQAHPNIKWIYSVFYYVLLPESLPSQYKKLPFSTTSYEPSSIKSIQSGTLKSALPVLPMWMGYYGVGAAVEKLNGGEPTRMNCLPFPPLSKASINTKLAKAELFPASYKPKTG
jgi:ABC-type sugar transport system substrate-binding protein